MSRNFKSVYGKLKSVFNNLKRVERGLTGVIHFTAPSGLISSAEAEVRASFYPSGVDDVFISLLNGVKLKETLAREGFLVIKKPGGGGVRYALYDIGGECYALALDLPPALRRFGADCLKTSLKLCLEFYETERSANLDAMTGLFNHGYFQRELRSLLSGCEAEFESLRENDAPLEYNLENSNVGLILF
ncbi:MAG TPA: hypothetical protein PK467_09815, partial [Candidatus Wallbacteria bacterium]|nr:hypothetical protein [Candidatus Wallbacteria bacterium]